MSDNAIKIISYVLMFVASFFGTTALMDLAQGKLVALNLIIVALNAFTLWMSWRNIGWANDRIAKQAERERDQKWKDTLGM